VKQFDVLIVGSGAAGLSLALQLPGSLSIGLLSKADVHSGSTSWAQGGMAAVLHERDTVESHVEDTLQAGAGLCHEDAGICATAVVGRGFSTTERGKLLDKEAVRWHWAMGMTSL